MMKTVFTFLFLFFTLCGSVQAASDTFHIKTLVGDDTLPPTTPTSLTATPVAQTQINLSWGASTDDFVFGGYQVFRDTIQIATTTLTTYSDTGLSANTTYSYYVRAFDTFPNFSSSSNSVSTTTFAIVSSSTPPTASSGGGSSATKPELVSFTLTPTQRGAAVSWEVSR